MNKIPINSISEKLKNENDFLGFNINIEKNLDNFKKLINLLINEKLLEKSLSKNTTPQEIKEYMLFLLNDKKISINQYIQFYIQTGNLMLGEYLEYKGIISKEEVELVTKIQKENKDKKYGEILIEEGIINDKNIIKFTETLKELGVIRLGEYLVNKGKITINQIEMFLKTQEKIDLSFGQVLLKFGILNKEELEKILNELGIVINYNEKGEDIINEIYQLK